MANKEHLAKLREGVEAWNEWRKKNPVLQPDLQGVDLVGAQLQGAILDGAQLQGAYLNVAQLQKAHFGGAQLQGAYLSGAFFDNATNLREVILGDGKEKFASLGDVRWGGVNLAIVDWSPLKILGNEYLARRPTTIKGKMGEAIRLEGYRTAVWANRQLAVALRDQGLNEDADRFAYRAQVLQRKVLWMQKNLGEGFFPGFLLWYQVMVTGWSAFSLRMP